MKERDFFIQIIPAIADMAVTSAELDDAEYAEWQREALAAAESRGSADFIAKVLIVVNTHRDRVLARMEGFEC